MMFKKVNVRKQIFWEDVRQICIEHDYYTRGDVEEYSALADYVYLLTDLTDKKLMYIAQDIYNHSDVERIMNEGGVDECGVMESILFNLTEKVHTFYTVKEA